MTRDPALYVALPLRGGPPPPARLLRPFVSSIPRARGPAAADRELFGRRNLLDEDPHRLVLLVADDGLLLGGSLVLLGAVAPRGVLGPLDGDGGDVASVRRGPLLVLRRGGALGS